MSFLAQSTGLRLQHLLQKIHHSREQLLIVCRVGSRVWWPWCHNTVMVLGRLCWSKSRVVFVTHIICDRIMSITRVTSWCHDEEKPLEWHHDGISNHQPHDCSLNRLFRRRSTKTTKLRVTGLCVGNSPVNSAHKGPLTRKMFPFEDVIMHYKETHSVLLATCQGSRLLWIPFTGVSFAQLQYFCVVRLNKLLG